VAAESKVFISANVQNFYQNSICVAIYVQFIPQVVVQHLHNVLMSAIQGSSYLG
jgi:hypothetical protein